MYNQQGFLMQLLDPTSPGLFRITRGGDATSDALTYWRHEFRTYKQDHRRNDVHRTDDDADWHADGTPTSTTTGSWWRSRACSCAGAGRRPVPRLRSSWSSSRPSEAPLQ